MGKKKKESKEEPEKLTSGVGLFHFNNAAKYDGAWRILATGKKVRHGSGTFTTSQATYTGNWVDDQLQGHGTCMFVSGALYTGDFVDGKFHGQGTYTWPSGHKYSGSWSNNVMDGQGTFVDPHHGQWQGTFNNNSFRNAAGAWLSPHILAERKAEEEKLQNFMQVRRKESVEALKQQLHTLLKDNGCHAQAIQLFVNDALLQKTGFRGHIQTADDAKDSPIAYPGLKVVVDLLAPLCKQFEDTLSVSDCWAIAAQTAIQDTGGPELTFEPHVSVSAVDIAAASDLQVKQWDWSKPASDFMSALEDVGFTAREFVALCGAHTIGQAYVDQSGFEGKWTQDPLKFDNEYFVVLKNNKWSAAKSKAKRKQFKDKSGLFMTPCDTSVLEDKERKQIVAEFADDEVAFRESFSSGFNKLLRL